MTMRLLYFLICYKAKEPLKNFLIVVPTEVGDGPVAWWYIWFLKSRMETNKLKKFFFKSRNAH